MLTACAALGLPLPPEGLGPRAQTSAHRPSGRALVKAGAVLAKGLTLPPGCPEETILTAGMKQITPTTARHVLDGDSSFLAKETASSLSHPTLSH